MKLTDEQIEQAALAGLAASTWTGCQNWQAIGLIGREEWKAFVRAAAPYLQMPWEPPTKEEVLSALATYDNSVVRSGHQSAMTLTLGWLIAARNAALQPKPVDPRRDKITAALCKRLYPYGHVLENIEPMADDILAALDGK